AGAGAAFDRRPRAGRPGAEAVLAGDQTWARVYQMVPGQHAPNHVE
ncbi:hypothetical protein HMPREF1549_02053, partial [Actinomyces johnsonii F0510]